MKINKHEISQNYTSRLYFSDGITYKTKYKLRTISKTIRIVINVEGFGNVSWHIADVKFPANFEWQVFLDSPFYSSYNKKRILRDIAKLQYVCTLKYYDS